MMTPKVVWFLRSFVVGIAVFIGYGLVSEGKAIMITGSNLLLMGTALLFLVFLTRKASSHIYIKMGRKGVILSYFSLLFLSSLFFAFLKLFLCTNGIAFFMEWLSFFGILGVLSQPPALPSPSNSPSDSSQAEWDSFEEGVLLEEWPVDRNTELETSIRRRIQFLERENSVFLLDKEKGQFWAEIKADLSGCSTQKEYNQTIHFENRDLQVREHRHSCYICWKERLSEHPDLAERAAYECGFDPFGDARSRFDIRFYLVSILFIILDPEVTFFFPWAVPLNKIDPFGSWSMMAFLLILTIGFLYEWKRGASDRE